MSESIDMNIQIERAHERLSLEFSRIRAIRSGTSIYLAEHGLEENELAAMLLVVRKALDCHHIGSGWWHRHPLPLLVASTEVGYVYRGTGTDFWPVFADMLKEVTLVERGTLSALFREQAVALGLAQPSRSSWNEAFCHIAWPVLHAILPIELHRTLAETLRDVRSVIDLAGTDADLVATIRERAKIGGSVRLNSWLEEEHTAAAVVRHILDSGGEYGIAGTALQRIAADIARDDASITALREARIRQKALSAKPKQTARRGSEQQPLFAPLVLRSFENRLTLALKIPQMGQSDRELARSALDAMRWRAFLWGEGRPVPGRNIFSDFPLPLQICFLPEPERPLIDETRRLPIAQEAKDFLGSLRVATGEPLLFSDFGPDGDALQSTSGIVSDSSKCILLASKETGSPPVGESLGRVVGLDAFRLHAGDPANASWLMNHGFSVRKKTQFSWIGSAELEQHRPVRRFSEGSFVAFRLYAPDGLCEARLVCPNGSESTLAGEETLLAGFSATETGRYRIRYGEGDDVAIDIVESQEDGLGLLTVDIDAGDYATSDLADRKVTLRFNADASLQEAEFQLMVCCDGRMVNRVGDTLPDTPCKIEGSHGIWERLLDADTAASVLAARRAELSVEVSGLLKKSFEFEQTVAPFAWESRAGGTIAATDETGELAIFASTPDRPTVSCAASSSVPDTDIQLFRAGRQAPSNFGGICVGPSRWRSGDAFKIEKPERLMRRFSGVETNAVFGRDVVDALISWSAATVDNPVTQYRRGQVVRELEKWFVEQLCGPSWVSQEQLILSGHETGFVRNFLLACANLGVGYCDIAISEDQASRLDRILARLIEASGLFTNLETTHNPIDEDIAAELDDIFNEAYSTLYLESVALGERCLFDPEDDVDVGEVVGNWHSAIVEAKSKATLLGMVDLLRPLDAGDALSEADFEAMLPDEIVDLLDDWIGRNSPPHHARKWNRDLAEASFWLFTKPTVAARLSWSAATERMLADRFSARAVRYAALRARGGSE
ncbi:hypothetical protein K3725_20340 (plasmid) [Leisingera sp. S132]|uniref:hypothetical protein n=1 Tax=Leisingera sp. S132 TaxID=2867016 RepID=UPI0021A846F2|nr:hypothetical protein [Leisingera sp. S132]UWQ81463.1 hypothetical protein K3725_20340 [Leisingera sp. S132]